MLLRLMALFSALVPMVSAQSSASRVLQQESEDAQSVIVTSKTRAFLSCESGDMVVKVNFSQPFRGLLYAARNSACKVRGAGGLHYELRIPLKGCGTWQESPRVFMNNITIRFHPALELEEDETKTIVCRYPPPLTPPPGSISVISPPATSPASPKRASARLSEVEILILICVLLFLSLVTLGIGIAYFCLKRRRIRLVRKSVASSSPPSQLTKLSSTRPPPSLLGSVLGHTVRIPRAVPYSAQGWSGPSSSSGSSIADDASSHLLFGKVGASSLLSIPKAILRKNGFASVDPGKPRETEDQTVAAVLGAETGEALQTEVDATQGGFPVYAKVDKSQKERRIAPEDHRTTEEVTKNTTVTTCVHKEVRERRLPDPTDDSLTQSAEAKSLLIQDVSDVYVTTTVETELRESKTTVETELRESKTTVSRDQPPGNGWNVVIRERRPRFDVTIRAVHPEYIQPKKEDALVSIPPLEMPASVGRLREALQPKGKARSGQRTVRWSDAADDCETIPEESSISSSDSFRSEESLRERSSSEVLEVAPTLPGHPMLERSTSEIEPEDHTRRVGRTKRGGFFEDIA